MCSLPPQAVFVGSGASLVEAADSVSLIRFFCSKEGPGRLDSRCMEPVTNSCQRKGAGPVICFPVPGQLLVSLRPTLNHGCVQAAPAHWL